jgi:hypothetical protein
LPREYTIARAYLMSKKESEPVVKVCHVIVDF